MKSKLNLSHLTAKKARKEKISALTAYDYPMAKVMDEAGIDIILVGDSLGMVVLGYPDTLKVTMEDMIHHTKAVSRAVQRALVVTDMPFCSYGVSDELTVQNAARLIQEGGAQAVKLEGGKIVASSVRKMVDLGIPVLGHIGMTPTHVLTESGYHIQGKTPISQESIIEDALALQETGAFGVVLECIPSALAGEITAKLSIPTIGIGAGKDCDGQILVSYDLLGFDSGIHPKFVKHYAELSDVMKKACEKFKNDVEKGYFPGKEHSY